MKKIIIFLSTFALANCDMKIHQLQKELEYAKKYNNYHKVTALNTKIQYIKQNCYKNLDSNYEDLENEYKNKINKIDNELEELKQHSNNKAEYKAKKEELKALKKQLKLEYKIKKEKLYKL